MDSSGSIRDANYQKQKDFIREFSRRLDLRSKAVQLGLIVFSDVPFLSVRFGTLKSTDRLSFAAAVDAVPYFRGRTRIDSALDTAAKYLFPEGRQNLVPQIFFLITDGRQSQDAGAVPLDQAVRPLQQKGIKVAFCVHHVALNCVVLLRYPLYCTLLLCYARLQPVTSLHLNLLLRYIGSLESVALQSTRSREQ